MGGRVRPQHRPLRRGKGHVYPKPSSAAARGRTIYIGDVAFDTRAELEACRAQSGTRWDKDEIYFV